MNDLREIFVREIGLNQDAFSDSLAYNTVPEWDSTSHMIVILAIEEHYGVAFESDEIVEATTVGKIRDLLAKKGVSVVV